jgi:hypothetical protein
MKFNNYKKSDEEFNNTDATKLLLNIWFVVITVAIVYLILSFFSIIPSVNAVSINNAVTNLSENIARKSSVYTLVVILVGIGVLFYYLSDIILGYFKVKNSNYIGHTFFWWFLFLAIIVLLMPI